MRAMRDGEQPVQVQGGGSHAGVLSVRRRRRRGVAGGSPRLLLQAHEGPPYHGSSRHRRLPGCHQCHSHLNLMFGTVLTYLTKNGLFFF